MNEDTIVEQQSISLGEIFGIIKKYFWFLVIITLTAALVLAVYAFKIAKPKYEAKGEVIVQVKLGDEERYNAQESNRQIQTVQELVTKSLRVSMEASEKLALEKDIHISAEDIRKGLSTKNETNSLLITISFQSYNQEIAPIVTDYVIDALIDSAEFDISDDVDFKVSVKKYHVDKEAKYVSPNKLLLVLIGGILGGTVGLVIIFVHEMVTSGFKSKEELEQATKLLVLGVIPEFDTKGDLS